MKDHAKLVLGVTPVSCNRREAVRGHWTRVALECLLHNELSHVARALRKAHLVLVCASAKERESNNNQWRENVHGVEPPNESKLSGGGPARTDSKPKEP